MRASEQVPLGAILTPADGVVALQPDETYRVAGIYSFGRGLFERESILGAETAYATLTRLRVDQFVVSKLNGWEGAVDVVDLELDGCHVSGEYPVFSIDLDRADPGYLRWIARWPTFWDFLVPRGSMVRRKRVQPSQLLEVKIPLPTLEQQRRVAARLDRVQATIDHMTERADRSVALAEAFRAAITLSGRDTHGWSAIPLGEVLALDLHERSVDAAGSYDVAGVYSFGRGLFARGPMDGANTSYKKLHRLAAGQVVMSRLKAWEGALATVEDRFDGWFVSPEFPTFTPDVRVANPEFLNAVITAEPFWSALGSSSKGIGARRERVHAERLLEQRISLPPIDEQNQIVHSIRRIEEMCSMRSATEERTSAFVPAALNREFAALT